MTYKISYPQKWDKNGYHYTQLVTIRATEREFLRVNLLRGRILENDEKYDDKENLYFFNCSENEKLAEWFGYDKDKRYHADRNTCVRIIATL